MLFAIQCQRMRILAIQRTLTGCVPMVAITCATWVGGISDGFVAVAKRSVTCQWVDYVCIHTGIFNIRLYIHTGIYIYIYIYIHIYIYMCVYVCIWDI